MKSLCRFLGYSRPYWKLMTVALIASLVRMAMPIYMPVYVGNVIDHIVTPCIERTMPGVEAWDIMLRMTGFLLLLIAMHIIVTVGRLYLPRRASAAVVRDIRYQLFAHVQRLSLGFHASRPSGAIASRVITDVQTAQHSIEMGVIITCQALLQVFVIGLIMLFTDWTWALVAFAAAPLFLVTTWLLGRPLRRASRRMLESTERMSGHVHERFGMIREVQSFGAEHIEQQQVWQHTEQLRSHSVRYSLWHGMLTSGGEAARYLGLVAVLVFGLYRAVKGETTAGAVATFYLFTVRLFTPAEWLTAAYGQVQSAISASERIFEYLDTEPRIRDRSGAVDLVLRRAPTVRFDGLSFSYPVDKPQIVLKDLSFEVPAGSRVALVGPSGGGKSTMLSLLPRFYDIQEGHILIDDYDVSEVTVKSLRKAIGVVPQEPVLFSGTVRENILYGRLGASENDMLRAAGAANAHEFIMEQEAGYDTVVGERGVGLSGGQIQRIAIARAFLKDPLILILDEPTSNLDAVSESLILAAIDRLASGRTTFVVAHRLSVARSADLILVIDQGRLVERGRHQQLLEQQGIYHELWRRQVG